MIEGASQADRLSTFTVLMNEAGVNANKLAADLRTAAQGAVTLDTAIRPTLQLLKAGLPEAAAETDSLLKIATNAAILSGDLSQVDAIYQKLVRGIVRGSPRLIDDADIILKLGDAYDDYAASIGKTADELDATEQKLATLEAVKREGERINELAEEVDSAALVFQQMKVDVEEAGQAIKRSLADGIARTIKAWDEFIDLFDPMVEGLARVVTGSEEAGMAFEKALDARPIQIFVRGVLTAFDLLGATIRGTAAEIVEVWNALVSVIVTGSTAISTAFSLLKGEINADQALKILSDQLLVLADRTADALNPTNQLSGELGEVRERARAAGEELGFYASEAGAAGEAINDAANAVNSDFNNLSGAIKDAIEARTGLDAQYADRRTELEEDLRDRILEINENLGEKLVDISNELKERLIEANKEYQEAVTKLAEDTAKKLSDIDEDLADKLSEATTKAAEEKIKAENDRNKGVEDAYEKHQKKLIDIERRYEASRLKALIDRDARALFEAEQARAEGRNEANENLQDALDDEEEQYKEQVERIQKQEDDRRKNAIEAAEERRQDALDAQRERLDDLKKAYQDEKSEARKAYQEQRAEAIKAAREQRQETMQAHQESLTDLQDWYQEQLVLQKEAHLQQKINELEHLQEMGELTEEHLNELKGLWDDYNSSVSGATTPGGDSTISGITPSGGGSSGGGSGSTSSGGGGTIAGLVPGGSYFGPGTAGQTVGGSQRLTLSILSNDKMLEDVIRSSSYDAILDIVEE